MSTQTVVTQFLLRAFNKGLAVVTITGLCSSALIADTVYVNASASGAGTGTSWTDAITQLDVALAAANSGDEIWVASGTYSQPGTSTAVVLRTGIALYGGFAGTELQRSQRNPAINTTTLGGAGTRVVVADGVDATAVIDGFSIVGGTTTGSGGGLSAIGGSPTVSNCVFTGNAANFGHGGAIFLSDSNASITHCTFTDNQAYQGSGGAIFVTGESSPTIEDCIFVANEAVATYGQTGQGGAIQLTSSRSVTISRCTFHHNTARAFNLGSYEIPRAGAISSFCIFNSPRPTTTIRECNFYNNQSVHGGAIFVWNPTTILNCSFDHNTAGSEGAGIGVQWTTASVVNSTIANNTGGESGGISVFDSPPNFPGLVNIRNSIIWGNTANGQDINVRDPSFSGPVEADNSCIQHLFSSDPGEDPIDPGNYPGCIITSPMLVAANTGDLQLLAVSPCIDAGGNTFLPPGTSVDLIGNTRVVRGLPGPGTSRVDMGAFEFGSSASCAPQVSISLPLPHNCPGTQPLLSLTINGSGPFTYQWRRNTVNIAAASAPTFLASTTGEYDCLVTNSCGTSLSPIAAVAVDLGFQIDEQPVDSDTCPDSVIDFWVRVSGISPVTYQWRHNSVPIADATTNEYFKIGATTADAGTYDCVITSSCGSLTSDSALLTVGGPGSGCTCGADFNGDGFVDFFDYLDFVDAFSANSPSADFNNDTVIDFFDYLDFVDSFAAGC